MLGSSQKPGFGMFGDILKYSAMFDALLPVFPKQPNSVTT